jgi:hypothetical protein
MGDCKFSENVQRSADAVCSCSSLAEGLRLEILLTLIVEKSIICLVGTRVPIIIIQFNSVLYYLCAESTATRPITETAQCRYK